FDPKRVVESLHVDQRPYRAKLPRRMRIHRHQPARLRIADIRSPDLSERNEKSLLRRETIDVLAARWILGQCALERIISDRHAAEVRQVFAERELSIHMHAGQWLKRIVFVYDL